MDARELAPVIREAMTRLRPQYRRPMLLRYVEDRSYDNIAEILDLPLGTVKTYLFRGRRDLKKMLGPLLESAHSGGVSTPV